jgi:hypothetical protein
MTFYWGFSAGGSAATGAHGRRRRDEVVDELEIDGHPRIVALLRAAG